MPFAFPPLILMDNITLSFDSAYCELFLRDCQGDMIRANLSLYAKNHKILCLLR